MFPPKELSFVYIMYNHATGLYKIGITKDKKYRIKRLIAQSGCNIEYVLVIQLHTEYDESARNTEELLHEFFSSKRQKGEWFNLDVRDLVAIKDLFYYIDGECIDDDLAKHLSKAKGFKINKWRLIVFPLSDNEWWIK